jgi:hypothetical protein
MRSVIVAIWIMSGAGIIAGLFLTKDANCLWAFIIPMILSFWFAILLEQEINK